MSKEFDNNPFPLADHDRNSIWEMLVSRDIEAFCNKDWGKVENDFIKDNFMDVDGRSLHNPDSWKITFPNLASYQKEWISQAEVFMETEWAEDPEEGLYRATTLRDIEIVADSALIHKKFDGYLLKKDGTKDYLNWQTLYRCRKVEGKWKIAGFKGYLPNPMGLVSSSEIGKRQPFGASQHVTAGPYSPVLEVTPGKLVVISRQASIDKSRAAIGDNIEDQTKFTLENCRSQLAQANCSLDDVFKVNVFLTDLDNWPRYNSVYTTFFNDPKPVRTAVQKPLLMTLLVEVEMWAVKK